VGNVRQPLHISDSDPSESRVTDARHCETAFTNVNSGRSSFRDVSLAEVSFADVNLTNVSTGDSRFVCLAGLMTFSLPIQYARCEPERAKFLQRAQVEGSRRPGSGPKALPRKCIAMHCDVHMKPKEESAALLLFRPRRCPLSRGIDGWHRSGPHPPDRRLALWMTTAISASNPRSAS
jgi:hypothetical protein